MRLTCPNDHSACIRQDPDSAGLLAMCDTCGWRAPFAVAGQRYELDKERAGELEMGRKQLEPAQRRRGD